MISKGDSNKASSEDIVVRREDLNSYSHTLLAYLPSPGYGSVRVKLNYAGEIGYSRAHFYVRCYRPATGSYEYQSNEYTTNSDGRYYSLTLDITEVRSGDSIEIVVRTSGTSVAYIRDFNIYYDVVE